MTIYEEFEPTQEEKELWEDKWEKSPIVCRCLDKHYTLYGMYKNYSYSSKTTTYKREKIFNWDGNTLILNADDYPFMKPTNDELKCSYPMCNGSKIIHKTIITSHEYQEPILKSKRHIILPSNTRLFVDDVSVTVKDYKIIDGKIPIVDVRIDNIKENDIISIDTFDESMKFKIKYYSSYPTLVCLQYT